MRFQPPTRTGLRPTAGSTIAEDGAQNVGRLSLEAGRPSLQTGRLSLEVEARSLCETAGPDRAERMLLLLRTEELTEAMTSKDRRLLLQSPTRNLSDSRLGNVGPLRLWNSWAATGP